MVVPIGIAMTTTVIEEPRHSLLRMFVHQENRIHGNTNHTAHSLETMHRTSFGHKGRQIQLQVTHSRHIRVLVLSSKTSCAATAAATTTATAGAIGEVNPFMIAKGEDICSIHFGHLVVETKATP